MGQRERTARRGSSWRAARMGAGLLALYVAGCSDAAGPSGAATTARGSAAAETPVVFDQARLVAADAAVKRRIDRGVYPGAAMVVGVGSQEVHRYASGRVGWTDASEPVDASRTMYDLASLTKAVATTTAVMLLVDDGRMRLDDPVARWVPEFRDRRATIRQLLTHTAGVRAGAVNMNQDAPRAAVVRYLVTRPLAMEPGKDVLYSDIGFLVLYLAAERAAREPLPSFLRRRVWEPLGMTSTRFAAPPGCTRCAPTLRLSDGEPYRGGSYDEVGRALGGLSGNAGLFSTATDLSRFAAMIANGGELDGKRILRRETIDAFLRPQPGAGSFALGWVTYCREGKVPDHVACKEVYAIGHTGSTGTALWIDPRARTWMVLLTNRVYEPRRDADMQLVRRAIWEKVIGVEPTT